MSSIGLSSLASRFQSTTSYVCTGTVHQLVGDLIEAHAPSVKLGSFAKIEGCVCEVVGFRGSCALLMPLDRMKNVQLGSQVHFIPTTLSVPVGNALLGRVIDPLGRPMDGKPLPEGLEQRPLRGSAPNPMARSMITEPLATGIRVIDGMLTLGRGQRIAIMAGSGVGKSTLMGMFARESAADVNVIALVGERGREVQEFLHHSLGTGLSKSVLVVSTSDVSPALQIKGVEAAMSVAEYFREQGLNVLVLTDSLTRLAMAQRQIGLAAGEPPTTKGYPPSVFTMLPRLLERGGPGEDGRGTITSVSTILVEGDDMNDPVGDTVRGIVDGHVVLSRRLVSYGHYPPIDVLSSLSRTMPATCSEEHIAAATRLRRVLAVYQENEELIRLGAYKKGSDAEVDNAIELKTHMDAFLRQDKSEFTTWEECLNVLMTLAISADSMPNTQNTQNFRRNIR
ncbi:MAG: FliI/YscN family ATPase [Myxococcota bacterium]|nr:FliI/YscN family ATPase [Myxococcota bacterium]